REGEVDGRGFGLRFGALVFSQLLISTEILFTLTLALAGSLVLVVLVVPKLRPRLRSLVAPLLFSYAGATVIAAPFVYYLATGTGFRPAVGSENYMADLLNYVVPTRVTWLGSRSTHPLAHRIP